MEKEFDQKIKEALDAYNLSGKQSDWADFEQKLEMAELEADLSFDAHIAEQMGAMQMELGRDWSQMEELISIERGRRNQVLRMKATELLIFFLMLFTIFQIYPTQFHKKSPFPKSQVAYHPMDAKKEIQESKETHIKSEQALTKISATNGIKTGQMALPSELPSDRKIIADIQSLASFEPELIVKENRLNLFSNDFLMALAEQTSNTLTSVDKISTGFSEIEYNSNPEIALSKVKLNKDLFGKSIWLNVYAGMDLDVITTPYDEVFGLDAYTQTSGSNKIGASISFYQELLEWETGLNYSHKQFQPKLLVKEISGRSSGEYAETSLQSIGFSILQIPLQMKYHYMSYKGWRSYAMAGCGLNVVTQTKYDVRLKILSDTPNYVGPTPVQAPKINEKEFADGVLSNGSFYSNSYFTLNGGIGIQKGISGNMALFIEHSYQHHLFSGGIGPNMNKINNFSLVTGIKTNIY